MSSQPGWGAASQGSFRSFVAQRYPGRACTLLSDTNSQVYRIEDDARPLVVKHVVDLDIPLDYLAVVNETLGQSLSTQRIIDIHHATERYPYNFIVSEYIDGEDLAANVQRRPNSGPSSEAIGDFLVDVIEAMLDVPPLSEGFGLFKRDRPLFETRPGFLQHYAQRYWDRVRPFLGGDVGSLLDAWVEGGLVEAVASDTAEAIIAIDANLKNFIVGSSKTLAVLNVPIVGKSSINHAVGAMAVHLRHLPDRDRLLTTAERRFPDLRTELVGHFEMWNLLGILSFYAVREPQRPESWHSFSSPRPLLEDVASLALELLG